MAMHEDGTPFRVLLIDDDEDVADVVVAILTDEEYLVEVLADTSHESVMAAVGKQEPDCILLDGASGPEYGSGCYQDDAVLIPIGQFFELDAALAALIPEALPAD